MITFCVAVAGVFASVLLFKQAMEISPVAGAGAAGSIILLASALSGVSAIFLFGVTLGLGINSY